MTEYPTLKFFRDGNRTHPEEYTGTGEEEAGQGGRHGDGGEAGAGPRLRGLSTGPREAESIAEWLRRRVGSSATRLEDEESIQALIDAKDIVVIGFFQVSQWHGGPGLGSRA